MLSLVQFRRGIASRILGNILRHKPLIPYQALSWVDSGGIVLLSRLEFPSLSMLFKPLLPLGNIIMRHNRVCGLDTTVGLFTG